MRWSQECWSTLRTYYNNCGLMMSYQCSPSRQCIWSPSIAKRCSSSSLSCHSLSPTDCFLYTNHRWKSSEMSEPGMNVVLLWRHQSMSVCWTLVLCMSTRPACANGSRPAIFDSLLLSRPGTTLVIALTWLRAHHWVSITLSVLDRERTQTTPACLPTMVVRDVPDSNFDRIPDSWRKDSAGY